MFGCSSALATPGDKMALRAKAATAVADTQQRATAFIGKGRAARSVRALRPKTTTRSGRALGRATNEKAMTNELEVANPTEARHMRHSTHPSTANAPQPGLIPA